MYLLDTNVISELARGQPNAAVLAFLASDPGKSLCVVTLHELAFGSERLADAAQRQRLLQWTADIDRAFSDRILPIDRETAMLAGILRGRAQRIGRQLLRMDTLIAACASRHNLIVATRNIKDFAPMGVPVFNPWTGERA